MKNIVIIWGLLLFCSVGNAQVNEGRISFNWQNAPQPQFEFDLDQVTITELLDEPDEEVILLYEKVDNIFLHNYHRQGLNYQQMLTYYKNRLKPRGWSIYQKGEYLFLFTLRQNDVVAGIFVIVSSGKDVYLINILGKIPPRQVSDLLGNLYLIGIDIPELKNLSQIPESEFTQPLDTKEELISEDSLSSWMYTGIPIDDFVIQNTQNSEVDTIFKFLENGSGDVAQVLPLINKSLPSNRVLRFSISEDQGNNIAILTVENRKRTKSMSVLRSLTITNTGTSKRIKGTTPRLDIDDLFPHAATRFKAADAPIHEIRIKGNQKIQEKDILETLNNGSENIERALKTLFNVMPYFREIKLRVNEENFSRVATITVSEKALSSTTYIGLRPPLFLGFNRVNDWEFGTGFQTGKPTTVGPLWMWDVRDTLNTQTHNLYGRISYTLGNPHYHYDVGGRLNWGKPYFWHIGLTAKIHRQTDVVAPELFPEYNDAVTDVRHVLGYTDLPNYYLREGIEIGLRWSPLLPTHSFRLGIIAESHESLQKSTDWQMLQWAFEGMKSRNNPSITQGRMHSLIFQYDFSTRTDYLGWHNTFLVEHSNTALGSDFDYTRAQLHLRYAFPLNDHRIRTRMLFGFSDKSLPKQRQFAISGLGGLRGYPLYVPADDAEEASTKPWYGYSQYGFMGDRGFLLNVEFHYSLNDLTKLGIFNNAFLVFFIDEGQVWNVSDSTFSFDPNADVGIGLQLGQAGAIRFNVAKTLDSWEGYHISFSWYHGF